MSDLRRARGGWTSTATRPIASAARKRMRTSIRFGDGVERSAQSQSRPRSRCRTAENPPVNVRAAMTAFLRPLWAVTVSNESLGLRLGEVRHGPVAGSGESGNIRMGSAWRTSGGFAVFLCVKDAGKPCAFQAPKPVSGQTCPCKPMKGEWICRSRFMLDRGRFASLGARARSGNKVQVSVAGFRPWERRASRPQSRAPATQPIFW